MVASEGTSVLGRVGVSPLSPAGKIIMTIFNVRTNRGIVNATTETVREISHSAAVCHFTSRVQLLQEESIRCYGINSTNCNRINNCDISF